MSLSQSNKSGGRKSSGRRMGGDGRNASISTSFSARSKGTESQALKGTDRLAHIPDIAVFGGDKKVLDTLISVESFPRLKHIASAYQRVMFIKLVFRVVPQVPTTISGGYVAGFVADPSDDLGDGADAVNRLVAQAGAKVTKIWESATIVGKPLQESLFTSESSTGEIRLISPGRFVLCTEGAPQTGTRGIPMPLTVYCDWSVKLMIPSLESETGKTHGALVVNSNFYARSSNAGLWWSDGTGGDDPRTKIPGIQFDVVYKTPTRFYISYPSTAANYDRFIMVNHPTHGITLAPVKYATAKDPVLDRADKNVWVFEKGTLFIPQAIPNEKGLEFLCHERPSRTLQDPPGRSSLISQTSSSSSKRLETNKPGSIPDFAQSWELSSLTEFPENSQES